jgi:hypothetical protein
MEDQLGETGEKISRQTQREDKSIISISVWVMGMGLMGMNAKHQR